MMEKQWDSIAENVRYIREQIGLAALGAGRNPEDVSLMAVTKTVPAQAVNEAIAQGITLLGENRAQELNEKYEDYHKDNCEIHFIGALQTNKVRQIVDKVSMIHSVHSLKLAAEINRQAEKTGKTLEILIEVNVGREVSKYGVLPQELTVFSQELAAFPFIKLRGLMTIPPICDTQAQAEVYFCCMEQLLVDIKAKNRDNRTIDILSMGMSGDYPAAIRHGATIVRVGAALFGKR